ncbi:MAG: hypothetical protein EOP19_01220 [Hyphomicrobiales bacterium]|nr:MAG: hypothetical protein EOP19_01220 [Hyphomicrobiales bacterium]
MFALFAALIAIVAMTVPSLAMGSRGWISEPIPVVTMQPAGTYVRGPCLFTGGKTTSPCRPDIAVLPAITLVGTPTAEPPQARWVDLIPGAHTTEPSLPPPRLA